MVRYGAGAEVDSGAGGGSGGVISTLYVLVSFHFRSFPSIQVGSVSQLSFDSREEV